MSISSLQSLTDIDLDKMKLTPEAQAYYSQPNEIKRLLVERETYKRLYEEQNNRIDDFTKKWNKFLDMPIISNSVKSFRNIMNEAKIDYYFSKFNYNISKYPKKFNYKLDNEVYFVKSFAL
jgi:hypothetical protein